MNEKTLGYALIGLGITIILLAGISVYSVFAGGAKPINFFDIGGQPLDLTLSLPDNQGGTTQVPVAQNILSPQVFSDPLNSLAHLVLMTFLAGIGSRVASIGTQLVRPIKVNLKEAKTWN